MEDEGGKKVKSAIFVFYTDNEGDISAQAVYMGAGAFAEYTSYLGFLLPEDQKGAAVHIIAGAFVNSLGMGGGMTYYNFERGYISLDGEGEVVLKIGFNMKATGEIFIPVSAPSFLDTGFEMPANVTIDEITLIARFKAKYDALYAAGFHPGIPDTEGIGVWADGTYVSGAELKVGQGWIKQGFYGGSSDGFTFGNNCVLVYNIAMDEVFAIYGNVLNQIQYILYEKGAPTDDQVYRNADSVLQQFEKGYINAGNEWGDFYFFDGMTIGQIPDEGDDDGNGGCDRCDSAGASAIALTLGLLAFAFVSKKRNV